MPLDLSPDEAHAYLRAGDAPTPMLDLIGLMAARAAAVGTELGVFDALGAGPRGAAELAAELAADPVGLPALLDVLVAVGYLSHDGHSYANRPAADRWLRGDFANVLTLWVSIVGDLWGDLATTLRGGTPHVDFYTWLAKEPDRLERFQRLQRGLAGQLAAEVVERAPLPPNATRLLDLGGGHGGYSVAFCRRHPGLAATVLDLPAALPVGASSVAAQGLAERITFRAGDLAHRVDERDHDVVLLFNVVHGFAEERARALVCAAVAAVRPGGTVLVLETAPLPNASTVDDAFTRCFSLNLWHTQGGRVYPPATLARWLVEAGCEPPETVALQRSPSHVLLTAHRAAAGIGGGAAVEGGRTLMEGSAS
ncbi:SAM-dependent methyltransferase [Virgisporangium aliadipatigenens]|uniref:SAM-dependent methyltransferase n=1 Tax=Virgisporangium aliadipatigenens TaxID=741659 RepID=A0A8J4DQD2_9ACTN|nr:methyltransferase [Virgisporangium aliadipatigenens]GIJ45282.1 SAM-dependent methyltransferase [Virgisporangium aliadipatigenens]